MSAGPNASGSTRRDFLAGTAAGALGAAGLSLAGGPLLRAASAAPDNTISVSPVTIIVFLRGGQDSLNTLVPFGEGLYYDMRPSIAIPPPDKAGGALPVDGMFGFHPAMKGFKKLYDEKLLAPIVNVGSPNPSRSHFDCQDFIDFGTAGDKSVHEGWLNRYLGATSPGGPEGEFRALAMQGRLPRSLRGKYPVLAVPDRMTFRGDNGEDVLALFDDVYKAPPSMSGPKEMGTRPDEDELTQNGRTTIDTLRKLEEILGTKAQGEIKYPLAAGRLGQQLLKAARVIKSGRGVQVVGMDIGGWDTHINEGGPADTDNMWRMLDGLSTAITTFFDDIKDMRNQVTMLVVTEFGRTNEENGNRGTDHGHGSTMFAIGGAVRGGKVYGEWAGLQPGKTYMNRDLQVTTDYRQIFAEVLHDHMKLHPSKQLFPKFTPAEKKLGLFA
jgi:uncharacterized protein (DUF1501 family)